MRETAAALARPGDVILYEATFRHAGAAFADAISIQRFDRSELCRRVDSGGWENLRRAEAADAFRSASLRAANPADPESYKVRRGKIGGYVDYLSPGDIAYIDEREAESGCEFTRPYRTPAG